MVEVSVYQENIIILIHASNKELQNTGAKTNRTEKKTRKSTNEIEHFSTPPLVIDRMDRKSFENRDLTNNVNQYDLFIDF